MSRRESMDRAGENFFTASKLLLEGFYNTRKAITGIEQDR